MSFTVIFIFLDKTCQFGSKKMILDNFLVSSGGTVKIKPNFKHDTVLFKAP